MDKKERYVLFILLFIIGISIFLMALRGRYQVITVGDQIPLSCDTWTGRIYPGGTNDIYTKAWESKEANAQEQKREPRDIIGDIKAYSK